MFDWIDDFLHFEGSFNKKMYLYHKQIIKIIKTTILCLSHYTLPFLPRQLPRLPHS